MNGPKKIKLDFPESETLRYMGVPDGKADAKAVESAIKAGDAVRSTTQPRFAFRIFDVGERGGKIALEDAPFEIPGSDLPALLDKSKKAAVFAATLGPAVDAKIRELLASRPSEAVAFDAAASAAVESLADRVQEIISESPEAEGLFLTCRYSPGYGDLPLSLQPEILKTLDAGRKIGLTCTDSFILVPKKSVTAFIGLQSEPFTPKNSPCETCGTSKNCDFKAKGLYCGK